MPAGQAFANNLNLTIYNNVALADMGNTAGLQPSGVAGSFYVSLHTASPGVTGTPSTSEATYTGYARVAVPRSSAGFSTTAGAMQNAAAVAFPACTAGSNTVTYFAVNMVGTGGVAGDLMFFGSLASALTVSAGVTPSFAAGALTETTS